ncbi:unnamed protein product, partial [Symbiodinium microadriaticum]
GEAVLALARSGKNAKSSKELDLSNNCVGMVGVSKLCKALEGNTSLWSLALEGNEAEDEVITGVEALAADVAGRRERQPPKPRFAFSEPLPEDAEDAVSETSQQPGEFGLPGVVALPSSAAGCHVEEEQEEAEEQ